MAHTAYNLDSKIMLMKTKLLITERIIEVVNPVVLVMGLQVDEGGGGIGLLRCSVRQILLCLSVRLSVCIIHTHTLTHI